MGIGTKRNTKCDCGSGEKYKKCCGISETSTVLKSMEKNAQTANKVIPPEEFIPKWYSGLCSKDEINRLLNKSTPSDFLLQVRADQIMDHTRLYRVIIARGWADSPDLTSNFSNVEFRSYINNLPNDKKLLCKQIEKGYVFSGDANGKYMRSPYGDLIIISESLKYFLFYMNLFFLNYNKEIPLDVRFSSLMIAVRIMLQTEALDFDIDPRGIIPDEITKINRLYVNEQMQFVIGHEYSHYLLSHLDKSNTCFEPLCFVKDDISPRKYEFYNYRQEQEFAADVASIINPIHDNEIFESKIQAAIFFLIYIDIFQKVKEQILPSISYIKTHPDPIDRIWNLYDKCKDKLKIVTVDFINSQIDLANEYSEILQKHVALNFEEYEVYGSVYLGQWRGKPLIDRVDY